ncbi:MAG: GTP-binding protein [Promethearchaeota archaeon]
MPAGADQIPHMSSNIGGEAQRKYDEYLQANSLEERIRLLSEFLSLVPKHKATEKLVALNKARLAKLKRELEERELRRKRQVGAQKSPFSIRKAESAQVAFVSAYLAPGAGKSSLIHQLTGAGDPKDLGKFTPEPVVGIYRWGGLRFQFVDVPAIMEGASKGVGNGSQIFTLLRNADLIVLVVDLTRDVDFQLDLLLREMAAVEIYPNAEVPPVEVERTGSGKIQVRWIGREAKDSPVSTEDVVELARANGIINAVFKIRGKVTLQAIVNALSNSAVYKRAVVVATKGDAPGTEAAFRRLKERVGDRFRVVPSAIKTEGGVTRVVGFENFGQVVLDELDYVKIYTKSKKKGVADAPLVLPRGSTIADVAEKVHRQFLEHFKFAFVHRPGAKVERVKVGLNFEVREGDVVELFSSL